MHLLPLSLFSLVALVLAAPNPGPLDSTYISDVARRALPDNPSGGYAPATVSCPQTRPTIRGASTLSQSEKDWLLTRRAKTVTPMLDFLKASNITGFDAQAYFTANGKNFTALPNIGIAVSGGGYRALMNGAGFLAAADSRVAGSMGSGGLGGLLQASTYLAGLSGGGWLVGSMYANNFSTVTQLRDGSPGSALWAFSRNIFEGPKESGISIVNTASYWNDIVSQVQSKRDLSFDASITDYWGRALSYQLINATDGGPSFTFSSISRQQGFSDANQPLPILVADERMPGTKVVALNSTVVEFNPWEMGSFDPSIFGFVPLQYLGSNFSAGSIPNNSTCVSGFDQYGYIMGTSSSLFNMFTLQNISAFSIPTVLQDVLTEVLTDLSSVDNDIAQYTPNPFFGYNPASNRNAGQRQLSLVDGGSDLQNLPLHPLIQPERAVDVIFAVDSSADTTFNWPNGTALRASYDRAFEPIANGTQFPAVPDAETFIRLGLNRRPAFFGCDAANFTAGRPVPPLVVYIPNTPYTAFSNVSTFDPDYTDVERNAIIQNGLDVATMGNGTVDASWRACVGCAVLQRSLVKTATAVPAVCQQCFTRFCWNGTVDSRPVAEFAPTPLLDLSVKSAAGRNAGSPGSLGLVSAAVGILALAFVI